MLYLMLLILLGLTLLIAFVSLGLQGPPAADAAALSAVGRMVTLEGVAFVSGDRLWDDTEYQLLRSNPNLLRVAAQLRKERQELALLWISVLLKDLKALWCFRRFLIRRGAPTKPSEDLAILRSFVIALVFLNVLKLSVLILGPFALTRLARLAHQPVDVMSRAAATTLGRVPQAGWSELGRAWATAA